MIVALWCVSFLATVLALALADPGNEPVDLSTLSGTIMFSTGRNEPHLVTCSSCDWDLYSIRPDGSAPRLVTGGRDSDYAADATSDGSTIVFSRLSRDDGRWQLVLADTSGGNEHVVLTERYPIWLPRWSPDDTSVAYAATLRPNVTALFVMDMRTHAIRQLTQTSRASGPYADRVPVWSPDGSTIAFLRLFDDRPWLGTIELLDVGSGDVTPLVVVPRPSSLDWSPVGDTIVFDARGKEGTQDIFTISVSGSPEPMPLVEDLSTDALPAWSPDGRYIAFLSDRAGINDLYVMRADGTGVTRLPTGGGPNGSPEWFVGG